MITAARKSMTYTHALPQFSDYFTRLLIALASFILSACAVPVTTIYQIPDGIETADVEVLLFPGIRNYSDGFQLRGAPICNPARLGFLGAKIVEGKAQAVVLSRTDTLWIPAKLPAGVPIGLRFWKASPDTTRIWDVVVVLETQKKYSIALVDEKRVDIIDKATGENAARLPHDYFFRSLSCPS